MMQSLQHICITLQVQNDSPVTSPQNPRETKDL